MSVLSAESHDPAATQCPADVASRLFTEHSEHILGYCLRQLGSRAEAEDAAQTTFLHAFRALSGGVVPQCEVAWLTTIATNVCHTQRRTVERRGSLASDLDLDTIAVAQHGEDEEELLLGFKEALASMPEKQRHALVLREWQGMPAGEIASELGMSATATHALLTRARHSFAQALTLPRRPILGIAWLTVELRSHLKALLGWGSTKAAVTSVAVVGVGVGVGGVAMDRSLADSNAPPAPARSAERPYLGTEARASTVGATPPPSAALGSRATRSRTSAALSAARARPTQSSVRAVPPHRDVLPSDTASTPITPGPSLAGLPDEPPASAAGPSPPAPDLPVKLPVDRPQLPEIEPPTQLVPPVEAPPPPPVPVEPPPLPPVELPPLPSEVPPIPAVPLP